MPTRGGESMANLTEKDVERLRPKVKPYFVWDTGATGLGIKILPSSKKVWVLQLIWPGGTVQTKRSLGPYPTLGVAAARTKAVEWYQLAKAGVDPGEQEIRQHEAEARAALLAKRDTFAGIAEQYIAMRLPQQRWGKRVELQIRKHLIPAWGEMPIADISKRDVVDLIEKI